MKKPSRSTRLASLAAVCSLGLVAIFGLASRKPATPTEGPTDPPSIDAPSAAFPDGNESIAARNRVEPPKQLESPVPRPASPGRAELDHIQAASQKRADVRYADFLASLTGYSDERLESVRQALGESETELASLHLFIDFSSPTIKEELSAAMNATEQKTRARLASLMPNEDLERLETYVASLTFRENLPNMRHQLRARRLPMSEDSATAVARGYERAIEKHRAALAKQARLPDGTENETPSFDTLFLEEVAGVLEEESFRAFTDLYLDYQYK